MADLMNTKQAARYLGINEKKLYYLAKGRRIPCTRVTGKWIFPKRMIDQWIEENSKGTTKKRREEEQFLLLAAGSDDPSLGIVRDFYTRRMTSASFFLATVGSSAGLAAIRDGVADIALAHLHDPATGEYNLPYLKDTVPSGTTVVPLFHRELGLLVRPGNPLGLRMITDLPRTGVKIVNRQEGSGTRLYLDQEINRLGVDSNRIDGYQAAVATHLDVGLKVLSGEADAGVATMATSLLLGLDFVPFARERFDILIPRERFFSRGIQILLEIVSSREFRSRVEALGGYDTSESGRILSSD